MGACGTTNAALGRYTGVTAAAAAPGVVASGVVVLGRGEAGEGGGGGGGEDAWKGECFRIRRVGGGGVSGERGVRDDAVVLERTVHFGEHDDRVRGRFAVAVYAMRMGTLTSPPPSVRHVLAGGVIVVVETAVCTRGGVEKKEGDVVEDDVVVVVVVGIGRLVAHGREEAEVSIAAVRTTGNEYEVPSRDDDDKDDEDNGKRLGGVCGR